MEAKRRAMSETATVRNENVMTSQVDSETAEQFIAEKHIGERIKRLRLRNPWAW